MKKFCFILSLFLFSCAKKENTNFTRGEQADCHPAITMMDTAVLLVMGQSNAANFGQTKYGASCSNAINFYNGNFYPLEDPLHGATGDKGSVWSRLGDLLIQKGFAKVVIIAPVAIGGTTLQTWKPGGMNNHLIVEAIDSLKSKHLRITHVLWHQGEANNTVLNPFVSAAQNAQQYRSDFLSLVAQMRSLGVNAPVFPAIVTRCANDSDQQLEAAQRNLASDSLGIFNGPDTDLLGNEYRFDDCHFNDSGLKIHALLWADILLSH